MPRSKWSLAFRLTAWYTAASLLLLMAETGTLYWALVTNLERGSQLFLEDKAHVVTTLLRERPDDLGGLREEVEVEAAARRLEHFYIRILDDQGNTLMETPLMNRFLPPERFRGLTDVSVRFERPGRGL